jgi:hypothetical protein
VRHSFDRLLKETFRVSNILSAVSEPVMEYVNFDNININND